MKRPAVFVLYFQSPFQIVHVYLLLQSQYIFQKFDGLFNLMANIMAIFGIFTIFTIRFMKRLNNFMTYFQSSYRFVDAHKSLSSENIFQNIGGPFKMLTI